MDVVAEQGAPEVVPVLFTSEEFKDIVDYCVETGQDIFEVVRSAVLDRIY